MYIAYGLASWGEVKCRQIAASLPLGLVEKPERVIVGSDKLQPSDQADLDLN